MPPPSGGGFLLGNSWYHLPYHSQKTRIVMLKPIRWKTFLTDFLRIQIGFALFGLAIVMMIQANLGTSAWAVLDVALSKIFPPISVGTVTVLVGFMVLSGALILREPIGWGTLGNILSIGPWEDLWLRVIPSVKSTSSPLQIGTLGNVLSASFWQDFLMNISPSIKSGILPLQIGMLLVAIAIMGVASAIYIGVDAGAGPRDSLMLAIKRKTGLSIRVARSIIEVTVVIVGWLLGGPAGIGTVVFALLIGPAVQFGFKIFKVQPHREIDSEVEDG
jgi:uncharacterized membrane protein YczE